MTFAHSLRRCTLSTRSLKSVRIGPDKDICERAKVTADGGRITIRAEPPTRRVTRWRLDRIVPVCVVIVTRDR